MPQRIYSAKQASHGQGLLRLMKFELRWTSLIAVLSQIWSIYENFPRDHPVLNRTQENRTWNSEWRTRCPCARKIRANVSEKRDHLLRISGDSTTLSPAAGKYNNRRVHHNVHVTCRTVRRMFFFISARGKAKCNKRKRLLMLISVAIRVLWRFTCGLTLYHKSQSQHKVVCNFSAYKSDKNGSILVRLVGDVWRGSDLYYLIKMYGSLHLHYRVKLLFLGSYSLVDVCQEGRLQ